MPSAMRFLESSDVQPTIIQDLVNLFDAGFQQGLSIGRKGFLNDLECEMGTLVKKQKEILRDNSVVFSANILESFFDFYLLSCPAWRMFFDVVLHYEKAKANKIRTLKYKGKWSLLILVSMMKLRNKVFLYASVFIFHFIYFDFIFKDANLFQLFFCVFFDLSRLSVSGNTILQNTISAPRGPTRRFLKAFVVSPEYDARQNLVLQSTEASYTFQRRLVIFDNLNFFIKRGVHSENHMYQSFDCITTLIVLARPIEGFCEKFPIPKTVPLLTDSSFSWRSISSRYSVVVYFARKWF